MKDIIAHGFSYVIGVLLLLVQLPCLTHWSSQRWNDVGSNIESNKLKGDINDEGYQYNSIGINNGENKIRDWTTISKNNIGVSYLDRALAKSYDFNSTATSEDSNATVPIDDDTPIWLPVSGEIPPETIKEDVTSVIAVTSAINLELVETSSLMSYEQVQSFLEITQGFLSFNLHKGNLMPSLVKSEGIEVVLTWQKRSLHGLSVPQTMDFIVVPLNVSFQVTGAFEEDTFSSSSNFDQVLRKIFVEKEGEYLEALKFVDESFFSSLVHANLILEQEKVNGSNIDISDGKETPSGDIQSGNTQDTPVRNIFPCTETSTLWSDSTDDDNGVSGGGILSLLAIIGIPISILTLTIAMGALIYFNWFRKSRTATRIDNRNSWKRLAGITAPVDSVAEENLLEAQRPSRDKNNNLSTNDVESQTTGMHSYNTNGSHTIKHSDNSVHHESDSIAYAYSLEPEIETKFGASLTSNDRKFFSQENDDYDMPILVSTSTKQKVSSDDRKGIPSETQMEGRTTSDHFENIHTETASYELKLTTSEIDMLPSNLRSTGRDEEQIYSNEKYDDFHAHFCGDTSMIRKILAPAGKLGVVIDTTIEGPVVHSVNDGSQMSGKIFSGDIIVAIDEVDTRAMSASDINAIMVKTANQNRTLTVRVAANKS